MYLKYRETPTIIARYTKENLNILISVRAYNGLKYDLKNIYFSFSYNIKF